MSRKVVSLGVLLIAFAIATPGAGDPAGLTAAQLAGRERPVDLDAAQRREDASRAARAEAAQRRMSESEGNASSAHRAAGATLRRFDPHPAIQSVPLE